MSSQMKRKNAILMHGISWLLFFSYLLFAFWDRVQPSFLEWLWHPAVPICLMVFPIVFYGHWKVVVPRFFATQKYGIYLTSFVLSALGILCLKPVDRLMFRTADRFPPKIWHEHLTSERHLPPPHDPNAFFFDPTSLAMFLILWFLGLGIWLYQNKIKLLISALSRQIEAEAALPLTAKNKVAGADVLPQTEKTVELPVENSMTVFVEYEQVKILFNDIAYIEAFDGYVKIYLTGLDKPILTRLTLRAISEKLPEAMFVRIHRSFIISSDKASAWTSSKVRLKSGQELPLGRRFKRDPNV